MDSFVCGHCKREQNLEDAGGSGVCTCTNCGALLQVPSLQVLYRSALPPVAQILEAPKPGSPSIPPTTSPKHTGDTAENRASQSGVVSSRPVPLQPRSAAPQSVDRRLQEEMEAYQPKATHSLSRSSLFANAPTSPIRANSVKTVDISGGSLLRAPLGRGVQNVGISGDSVSPKSPEGQERTSLSSPETTSVSLSFGPKLLLLPGSGRASIPPSTMEKPAADVTGGAQEVVSAAGSPSCESVGPTSGAGIVSHRRAPSTDSDGSSASSRRLRAFSAKPVTESDLPPGVNIYVAQPVVPDGSEDDMPEFWAKPAEPPPGPQGNLPPGTHVFIAQPYVPGKTEDKATEGRPANPAPPLDSWSKSPPSTNSIEPSPYASSQYTDTARETGPPEPAPPFDQLVELPPAASVYGAQPLVDNKEKTLEAWVKPAAPDPGFQANSDPGSSLNPDPGIWTHTDAGFQASSDPWSEVGAEKVWEGDVLRISGASGAKAKSKEEPAKPPFQAAHVPVGPISPPERDSQLETQRTPPIFDEPQVPPETEIPIGTDRAEPVVPLSLRRVNLGRNSGGEDSGVPTTPPTGSGAPTVSPTIQRAMLEYQKMKALLMGGKSKSDPPRGVQDTTASDRGGSEAEEGAGSDQEVFEEIDLDEGGGSKAEAEAGGFKSGLKKWASGMEGLLRGVSVGKGSDKSDTDQSQDDLRGGGVLKKAGSWGWEEERAVGSDSLPVAEKKSVSKEGENQTTIERGESTVGEGKSVRKAGEDRTTIEEGGSVGRTGRGAEILVPKGVEIAIGEAKARSDVPAPIRRAVSEPVALEGGGPGSSSLRGVGRQASSGNMIGEEKSFKQVGTGANSGRNLVAMGGSGSGSFRGGAEVSRSGNYGSTSSLGAWSDDSECEYVRTVERVPLEEGGYVIRAVMKKVPRSGQSSPHPGGSRGASPEPAGDNRQSDVAPAAKGLQSDVAPAERASRSEVAPVEKSGRSDVTSAGKGSGNTVAPSRGGLGSDVAPAGKGFRSDVAPSGQGLSGEEGLPIGVREDTENRQSPGVVRDGVGTREGPEPSGRVSERDGASRKVSRDRKHSEPKQSEPEAKLEGTVRASAGAESNSGIVETSSSVEKLLERDGLSGVVSGAGEGVKNSDNGVVPKRQGDFADGEGNAEKETAKAESFLPTTNLRNQSLEDKTLVRGGSQPAHKTGTLTTDDPLRTGPERTASAPLTESVTSAEAKIASSRRPGKFPGLSRIAVPPPAERTEPSAETPKVMSARTKTVRPEMRTGAPSAAEAGTTASPVVTTVPLKSDSQRIHGPAFAVSKPPPLPNLAPNLGASAPLPPSRTQPVFSDNAGRFPQKTAAISSPSGAFPHGDLYPFIGYAGEPDLKPASNLPLNPPANPLPNPAQTESKPLDGPPVFPVRQTPPSSPKLSISPPTDHVPWTEKALSPTASAELPVTKLEIKPLPADNSKALQTSGSILPIFGGAQTSGVNAPLDTASGPPLERAGSSGGAFTSEGPKRSVRSRRTPSRTSSQEMTSPESSEPSSPAHRRSSDKARAGVNTPPKFPRDSSEGATRFASVPGPPGTNAERRGNVLTSAQQSVSKSDRKLAKGTWALGGAELGPPGEHTFSMWLDEDKKPPGSAKRGRDASDSGAASTRGSAKPVRNTPAPGAGYRGTVGKGPNETGDSSPGPKVHGRTDSDLSVRTSEFEGGISSFAGSETSFDSPPHSPEPKLPEFHPPEKFAALFEGQTNQSGGPSKPPRSSPTRGSPPPGWPFPLVAQPLPSGAPPIPPFIKDPSFGDVLKERRALSPEPSEEQERATREESVPSNLQFWPSNGPPQNDVPTPPMPGRPLARPPLRASEPNPTNPQQSYNPLVHPPGFQPAALIIPNPGFTQPGPRSQSFASQSSTPSPDVPPGYRPGLAEPYSGSPGVRDPGFRNPQLSFGSQSSGNQSQNPGYANPDLNRQDSYARSFGSHSSGLGQSPAAIGGTRMQSQESIRRKGLCSMCGQKSNKKVQCLVCNKKYCERCVERAMGFMPEGRKCVGCVGLNIDEANRPHLGRSDSTIPGLAKDRTSEILKAELVSVANLAGSERVVVNRKPLTREELAALFNAERPPPRMDRGNFWYDARSGLWGKMGRPFERIVAPGLEVGGPLPQDASSGSTRVYLNGRELGKRELRLFKFAGAKLKSNKRIWLDADGAYGEEGGPAKGNMWELKPLQLMLPLFGRPASEVETRLAKELQAEAASRVSKLLLVGPPETGKSTFARVVREMYGSGFSEEEQAGELRAMVLANVLHCARRLLEGRKEKFDDEEGEEDQWKYGLEPENEPVAARALMAISTALGIAEMEKGKWLTLDYKLAGDLQRLWRDPGVQATFRVGGDISLPDSTDYFMDRLAQISAPGYVPSWDDVMACQVLHQVIPTGVTQVDFSIDDPEPSALSPTVPLSGGLPSVYELENAGLGAPFSAGNAVPSATFRLLDVGPGHLADSPGWRRACDMFQDVSAVLFFVGLSDFDRFHSVGGEFHNRLEDARDLFESVINSPSFENKPILLLFNKFDLFCRKLRANTSLTECDWLEDYDPGDHSTASDRFREDVEAQNAYMYIEKKFTALVEERNKRAPQVEVLVYKLSAVQQESVDMVLMHLPDIVL
ncbi:hypothetical protein KFL_003040070 [Klebsormidium nitens]|uniref:Uncharacterized protein n=1 Tax=Klebsormidium nitens TaxID=105231 RepID=A0A1Y1I6V8_KLENI|nr:hypothetical protein KFL_003040070 [Klebsormidium nitens]|eukprot:GAQ86680.1 hypothetical protein KFL_003040070 [Klebsormidium nitens]